MDLSDMTAADAQGPEPGASASQQKGQRFEPRPDAIRLCVYSTLLAWVAAYMAFAGRYLLGETLGAAVVFFLAAGAIMNLLFILPVLVNVRFTLFGSLLILGIVDICSITGAALSEYLFQVHVWQPNYDLFNRGVEFTDLFTEYSKALLLVQFPWYLLCTSQRWYVESRISTRTLAAAKRLQKRLVRRIGLPRLKGPTTRRG